MAAAGIDLSQVPAMAPPAGQISNFEDPYNRGPAYIVVAAVFMGLATFFVSIRLWARLVVQQSPWWDDAVCVLALLCQATYCGLNIWLCLHGVGKHMWDVHALSLLPLIEPARVMAAVTEPAIGFTKLALMLFYYRIFSRHFVTKLGIFAGLAIILPLYTTLFFLFVFLDTTATTSTNKAMAVLNVVSDFYILVLPLPAVLGLNLPAKKKAGLVALFSTGFFACIMSIVGAVYRFQFANNGADFTFGLLNVILVNTIECSVGIICACLPLFPAVLSHTALGQSADWFVLTLRSIRERLLSSRSRVASINEVHASHNNQFYHETVYPAKNDSCYSILLALYNWLLHPLSVFPGPKLSAASRLPYAWRLWQGQLHENVKQLHDIYGPVVRIAPDELSFNVNSAWNAIYCGGPSNKGFPKHNAYRNAQTFESLFDAPDDQHTRLRRLLKNDFFSLRAARRQEHMVQVYADRLIAQLRAHHCHKSGGCMTGKTRPPPADMRQWYNFATFDLIGHITLSEDFGCLEGQAYHPWILMVLTHFKLSALVMCSRFFPPLSTVISRLAPRRLMRLQNTFIQLITDKVDRRLGRRMPPGQQDFVSIALREGPGDYDEHQQHILQDDSGSDTCQARDIWVSDNRETSGGSQTPSTDTVERLNKGELEANCILLLLAGSETIATSLLSATHLLCEHADAMRVLVAEIHAAAPTESHITFTNTTMNMPYLNAVLRETHRLCPPLANGPARVVGDSGAVIAGWRIPPGTTVGVTQYAANRCSANFTRPEDFLPERWLSPEQAEKYGYAADHQQQFVDDSREVCRPFSTGGRDCLGQNLAWVEFRIMLARMIWNFELDVCPRREKNEHDAWGIGGSKTKKNIRFSAFRKWSDLKAFMLWQKESYFVWLRERHQ
ncbi:hypothetical protein VSDG_09530 [Cytospora chrysosperma]|uniref:Rhodopsin domain-containing protein n=1 Tax=Cytospora chrysosperma TaxID=252740 RepID=A0A423VAF8_CYTCH|nr:hypothetical protein VSDG_09530 [Valsa sordida]